MRLDATTLAITAVALTGVVAAILFAARRRYDDGIRDSLSIWAGALLCLTLSASLFIRPLSSTLAVILVGNSALVAGYTGFVVALRRFLGLALPRWAYLTPLLTVIVGTWFFSTRMPSYPSRVALAVLFLLVLLATLLRPILRSLRRGGEIGQRVVALSFMLAVLSLLLRIAWELPTPGAPLSALAGFDAVGVHLLAIWIAPVLASIGFLLMCNEQLMAATLRLATIDALTGTLGRRAVLEHSERMLAQARRQQSPMSVLMFDADHFKHVNDTHGHEVGDAVLVEMVRRTRDALREQDVLGRIGGEEFLALLPGTNEAQALQIAERLLRVVRESPFVHGHLHLVMTISVGIAQSNGHDHEFDPLLKRADDAMYAAKREGRNRIAITPQPSVIG